MKSFINIVWVMGICLVAASLFGCSDSTAPDCVCGQNLGSAIDQIACNDCQSGGIIFTRFLNDLIGEGATSEVMRYQDGELTRVTDNLSRNENPVWLPHMQAFIDVTMSGNSYLEVVCADGSMSQPLFPDYPKNFHYLSPSVTADGQMICYIKQIKSGGFTSWVQVYRLKSGAITEYSLGEYGPPMSAEISPDGRYIACGTFDSRICVINTQSGSAHLITDTDSGTPAWSPNSRQVVYSQKNSSNQYCYNLWLQDVETGNRRQLTTDTWVKDFDPCFNPSGTHIVFARRMLPDYGDDIYRLDILNLWDGMIVQITEGGENDRDPSWR